MSGSAVRGGALALWVVLATAGCNEEVAVQVAPATGGAGFEGEPTEQLNARVETLRSAQVVLEDEGGRRYYLSVGPHTSVTQGDRATSLLALKSGASVAAEYVNTNGELRATRLKIAPAQ